MKSTNPLRRVLAQVTLFLPLLLLSALALGSFLLYQITPGDDSGAPVAVLGNGPDYFVEKFAARQYDAQGKLLTEVFGQKAVHYPAARQLDITQIKMNGLGQDGKFLSASANQAITNDERNDIQLSGNAQVRLTPRLDAPVQQPVEFFSERLRLLLAPKILISEVPVRVVQGQNTFSSATMHYDHSAQVLSLKGDVRLTLFPKKILTR